MLLATEVEGTWKGVIMKFKGYIRENGDVGIRNEVAIMATVVCVNEVVDAIVKQTKYTAPVTHHQGCCQLPFDLERVTESLIRIGENPNVGAVLLVSLGCEGTDVDRVESEIKKTGKPVERINIQELGGMSAGIADGLNKAQKLVLSISNQTREEVDISKFTMGIKCGASDATSGISSNAVIGYVADKLLDAGATVMFGETTEFIGAEHVLKERAKNQEVSDKITEIVDRLEKRVNSFGVDMRKGQPTPGNIKGGLTTIEEKSLGAIVKSGTKIIEDVLEYTEKPKCQGLFIKDTPGREPEILTGMAIGGAQIILFSTGRGAPQGFPVCPVIKICGNPITYENMETMMDINAGKAMVGEMSIEEIGEQTIEKILRVLSGETTKGESIKYTQTMDIYTLGPVI